MRTHVSTPCPSTLRARIFLREVRDQACDSLNWAIIGGVVLLSYPFAMAGCATQPTPTYRSYSGPGIGRVTSVQCAPGPEVVP